MTETAKERIYREAFEEIKKVCDTQDHVDNDLLRFFITKKMMEIENLPVTTDKLSVEKPQEELESCIQTLIEASVAANITQDIVVGNLVDRKLAGLAKTHKLAVDYIEKVTGKNIDVVLAENAALEAEEEE
ncbi:hypothetical protein [Lactococcus lactis]|uniref:Phage protein n=1 Tax=Lactococcus lactis TaxID=1358 RepID=A0AAW8UEY7_9LACT|nr:hypothetical protein [Lactococcus lactis]MDT2880315.1 hypothetical protein [Lactococcus lactis]MDT2945363.1 hypothetical protein [Lactococcus lactis]MDT2947529.1 hypothetical protein [Lactococcus lactis]